MRAARLLLIAALASLSLGCGGSGATSPLESEEATAPVSSTTLPVEGLPSDIREIRARVAPWDDLAAQVSTVMNELAVDPDATGEDLKAGLVPLLDKVLVSGPPVQQDLAVYQARSLSGERVKNVYAETLTRQIRNLRKLREALDREKSVWKAAVDYGDANHRELERFNSALEKTLSNLVPEEQEQIADFIREVWWDDLGLFATGLRDSLDGIGQATKGGWVVGDGVVSIRLEFKPEALSGFGSVEHVLLLDAVNSLADCSKELKRVAPAPTGELAQVRQAVAEACLSFESASFSIGLVLLSPSVLMDGGGLSSGDRAILRSAEEELTAGQRQMAEAGRLLEQALATSSAG